MNDERIRRIKQMQAQLHYRGLKDFMFELVEAMHQAADDTESFEDKRVSQEYADWASTISQLLDEVSTHE